MSLSDSLESSQELEVSKSTEVSDLLPKNEPKSSFNPSGVVFPVIVDVFAELQKGNFLPLAKLLKAAEGDPSIDLLQRDGQGNTLLHQIILTGNFPLIKIICNLKPELLSLTTSQQQTNLMISVNQKTLETVLFFKEKCPQPLNTQDKYGFTVFFYLVRNNSIPLFLHLLDHSINEKAYNPLEFAETDSNGCSLIHWAAYRDSVFFLLLFLRLGGDLLTPDSKNLITFERALENNAVRVLRVLERLSLTPMNTLRALRDSPVQTNFDFFPISDDKFFECGNTGRLLDQYKLKRRLSPFSLIGRFKAYWRANNPENQIGVKLYLLWVLLVVVQAARFVARMQADPPTAVISAVAVIALICSIFSYVFLTRNDLYRSLKAKKSAMSPSSLKGRESTTFERLCKNSSYYIPHQELKAYQHSFGMRQDFDDLLEDLRSPEKLVSFDSRFYCPLCTIKKPAKTRHVLALNLCVRNFHLYSKFFDKLVFGENFREYFLVLFLNLSLLFLALYLNLSQLSVFSATFVVFWLDNLGAAQILFLLANLFIFASLLIDFLMAVYCVCRNLTLDELRKPHHYPYLYVKKEKKVLFVNDADRGLVKNLIQCLSAD